MAQDITILCPSANEIEDVQLKERYWQQVCRLYGKDPYIALKRPISLRRSTLSRISPQQYRMTEKSDGIRYLFVLMDTHVALLIDRAKHMFSMSVAAQDSLYLGSIFDCELVACKNFLKLLVFDVYALEGKCTLHNTLVERSALYEKRFVEIQGDIHDFNWMHDPNIIPVMKQDRISWIVRTNNQIIFACLNTTIIIATPKKHEEFKCLKQLVLHKDVHKKDGLIFTPLHIHNPTYKWKTNHTIDVSISITPGANPVIQLTVPFYPVTEVNTGKEKPHEIDLLNPNVDDLQKLCFLSRPYHFVLPKSTLLLAMQVLMMKNNTTQFKGIMECGLVQMNDEIHIQPLKTRPDKDQSNNWNTVHETVVNLIENITLDELDAHFLH